MAIKPLDTHTHTQNNNNKNNNNNKHTHTHARTHARTHTHTHATKQTNKLKQKPNKKTRKTTNKHKINKTEQYTINNYFLDLDRQLRQIRWLLKAFYHILYPGNYFLSRGRSAETMWCLVTSVFRTPNLP